MYVYVCQCVYARIHIHVDAHPYVPIQIVYMYIPQLGHIWAPRDHRGACLKTNIRALWPETKTRPCELMQVKSQRTGATFPDPSSHTSKIGAYKIRI